MILWADNSIAVASPIIISTHGHDFSCTLELDGFMLVAEAGIIGRFGCTVVKHARSLIGFASAFGMVGLLLVSGFGVADSENLRVHWRVVWVLRRS